MGVHRVHVEGLGWVDGDSQNRRHVIHKDAQNTNTLRWPAPRPSWWPVSRLSRAAELDRVRKSLFHEPAVLLECLRNRVLASCSNHKKNIEMPRRNTPVQYLNPGVVRGTGASSERPVSPNICTTAFLCTQIRCQIIFEISSVRPRSETEPDFVEVGNSSAVTPSCASSSGPCTQSPAHSG
ncbi:hypothetical protein K491DRAFT_684068 [Lophiostoma macrostomum CBS 122681]|uniref:Uncharacterized protein n=1 Tax=Lophiostoma macrostomum CBS 122681 TaxID=1314788 RepID=A0A6A6SSK3_9PLEO|nr:hypothetical protein K491DRAFT_684068 [Lophiostoma macrostomum CBS 122681]